MLYRETIAVYSQIHTKHINTLCGQNVVLLNVKLAVHIVTTVRYIYWPLCGTYSDHCAVRINTANMLRYCLPRSHMVRFYSVQLCGDYWIIYSGEPGENDEEPRSGCPIPRLIFDPGPGEHKTVALPHPTPRNCTLKVILDTWDMCVAWRRVSHGIFQTSSSIKCKDFVNWSVSASLSTSILLHRAS